MRPADLLAAQADLVHRCEDPMFTEILTGSMGGPYMPPAAYRPDENGIVVSTPAQRKKWQSYVPGWIRHDAPRAIKTWAQFGMAIEVTEHMVDLINWVANEFDGLDRVDLGLAPSPYGFVHFAKPLKLLDIRGEELWTDWLVWGPVPSDTRCIGVLSFNDMWLGPDPQAVRFLTDDRPQAKTMMSRIGRWAYSSFLSMSQDERMGPQEWPVDDLVELGYDKTLDKIVPTGNLTRLIYALWTVMNQPIAVLEKQEPDRATKRRMTRMKIPPAVTVITLRRPENPHRHDEEGHVEWQHHWLVRGHPRWQAYGPQRSERKLIWVNPHFKGNMDAPLHQSDKVYKVSR